MEQAEGSIEETLGHKDKGTLVRKRLDKSCKNKFLDNQKPRKGYLLPSVPVTILCFWLFKHPFNACLTEEENQMLSKKTNLSHLQISNWFTNACRCLLPEVLQQDLKEFSYKGQAAEAAQKEHTRPSEEAKAQPNMQTELHNLPLQICQESPEKLTNPKSSANQVILEAYSEKECKIYTSEPLSSSESVQPKENPDFSSVYMLFDAAIQKAAEL